MVWMSASPMRGPRSGPGSGALSRKLSALKRSRRPGGPLEDLRSAATEHGVDRFPSFRRRMPAQQGRIPSNTRRWQLSSITFSSIGVRFVNSFQPNRIARLRPEDALPQRRPPWQSDG